MIVGGVGGDVQGLVIVTTNKRIKVQTVCDDRVSGLLFG